MDSNSENMILNVNIGILGHVDVGKTTLAKALSEISSTAAFDKHPQSIERGITLDLGFSALITEMPDHLNQNECNKKLQLTFVDCPGHHSLMKTIIGGVQIIDIVLLVIDVQKGIQTQAAECIVLSELTNKKLIVILNKIDLLPENTRTDKIKSMESNIRKTLKSTKFGFHSPIISVSALKKINLEEFVHDLKGFIDIPQRNITQPFLLYFDHCFKIKGQGTVCTGTILQGKISLNDTIEIPLCKETRKVKSIQMFHKPVKISYQGDRVGICFSNFDSSLIERGILCAPDYVKKINVTVIDFKKVKFYKHIIKSGTKYHITVGHETQVGKITIFRTDKESLVFNLAEEYEYVEDFKGNEINGNYFALLEFETPILSILNTLVIGSKLDLNNSSTSCRIAFSGHIQWFPCNSSNLGNQLADIKIYKEKIKSSPIQRVLNTNEIIVCDLFKSEVPREMFIGKKISLSTGEQGYIDNTFGQKKKIKIKIPNGLTDDTMEKIKSSKHTVLVSLKFRKYIFNKSSEIIQGSR